MIVLHPDDATRKLIIKQRLNYNKEYKFTHSVKVSQLHLYKHKIVEEKIYSGFGKEKRKSFNFKKNELK